MPQKKKEKITTIGFLKETTRAWAVFYLVCIMLVIYFTGWAMGKKYAKIEKLRDSFLLQDCAKSFCEIYEKEGVIVFYVNDDSCGYVSHVKQTEDSEEMRSIAQRLYEEFRKYSIPKLRGK